MSSYRGLYARIGRLRPPSAALTYLLAIAITISISIPISTSGCVRATPAPEPVTISFAYPRIDTEYYEPLAQTFNEQHPYITVELRPMPWRQIYNLSADDADVFWVSQFFLGELWKQGGLLELDSFIEEDVSLDPADFYPGVRELLTREGKVWAVPAGADVVVMYYNQDLLDQYHVPYPEIGWTWGDFLTIALALRDPDADIFGYGPRSDMSDSIFFIYQHGGRIFDDLKHPTRTTFDDPLTIDALEWYAKLFHEHDVAPTPDEVRTWGGSRTGLYRGVQTGKVGMWMGMLSERGGLTWPMEWPMRWGMVPLPSDAQSATQVTVEGYAISSQTRNRDACWQWMVFLGEQTPYRLMPARRSLAESTAYEEQVGSAVAATARASMEDAMAVDTEVVEHLEEAVEVFNEAVGTIVSGDSIPWEAMDRAQREVESKAQP